MMHRENDIDTLPPKPGVVGSTPTETVRIPLERQRFESAKTCNSTLTRHDSATADDGEKLRDCSALSTSSDDDTVARILAKLDQPRRFKARFGESKHDRIAIDWATKVGGQTRKCEAGIKAAVAESRNISPIWDEWRRHWRFSPDAWVLTGNRLTLLEVVVTNDIARTKFKHLVRLGENLRAVAIDLQLVVVRVIGDVTRTRVLDLAAIAAEVAP